MLTVAEGGAFDAHPVMRSNVILAKAELMKLVFMDLRFLIGFTGRRLLVRRWLLWLVHADLTHLSMCDSIVPTLTRL